LELNSKFRKIGENKLSKDLTEPETKRTKQSNRAFFSIADDEILITHDTEPKPHRIVFLKNDVSGDLSIKTSVFFKLDRVIESTKSEAPMSYFRNESYTLGLSKHGKIVIYVKSDISVFPKEFLRSLTHDFKLNPHEISFLIRCLDFVELEISHKINDPLGKLKKAKVEYKIDGLINKLIAFTDNSFGSIELELKGDPETSGNLDFLLRDKLNAILFFAELTKIIAKFSKIQNELNKSMKFIENGIKFLIDDLLNEKLVFTEQNKKEENNKNARK